MVCQSAVLELLNVLKHRCFPAGHQPCRRASVEFIRVSKKFNSSKVKPLQANVHWSSFPTLFFWEYPIVCVSSKVTMQESRLVKGHSYDLNNLWNEHWDLPLNFSFIAQNVAQTTYLYVRKSLIIHRKCVSLKSALHDDRLDFTDRFFGQINFVYIWIEDIYPNLSYLLEFLLITWK